MSFSGDIRNFAKDATEAHNKITRAVTLELFADQQICEVFLHDGRGHGSAVATVGAIAGTKLTGGAEPALASQDSAQN